MSENFTQPHPEEQQRIEVVDGGHTLAQQGLTETQVPMQDGYSSPEIDASEESGQPARVVGEVAIDSSNDTLQPSNSSSEMLFRKDNLRQKAQEYIERNANSPVYAVFGNGYSNIAVHKEILKLAAGDIDKLHTISQAFMDSLYSEEGSVYKALDALDAVYSTHAYDPSDEYNGMADGYYSNSLSLDDILSQHGSSFKAFMEDAGEEAESLVSGALDALNEAKETWVQSLFDATVSDKDGENRHVAYSRKSDLRTFVNSVLRAHLDGRDREVRQYRINQEKPYAYGNSSIQELRERFHAEDNDLPGSFTYGAIELAQSDIETFCQEQIRDSIDVDYDSGEVWSEIGNFHFGQGEVGRDK